MLLILRYQDELRKPETYFDAIDTKVDDSAVKLAVDLVEQELGKFEPENMPNEYARAVHELVQAKIEQRAPEVEIQTEKRETPKVVNIMDALKKSMQAKGQTKVRTQCVSAWVRPRLTRPSAPQRVPSRQTAQGGQCISGCYVSLGGSRLTLGLLNDARS